MCFPEEELPTGGITAQVGARGGAGMLGTRTLLWLHIQYRHSHEPGHGPQSPSLE